MDEITKTRLIIAVLDRFPDIDSNMWFSTTEGYKVSVVDMIRQQDNKTSLEKKLLYVEDSFIRAVVGFLLTLQPGPMIPCSFHPNSSFDLPKCKNYTEQLKSPDLDTLPCNKSLTLQDRKEQCPYFEAELITQSYRHANGYVNNVISNLSIIEPYSIRRLPV